MPNKKNNKLLVFIPALALICAGCTIEKPVESLFDADQPPKNLAKPDLSGRFQSQVDDSSNPAVQSAIELSSKYTKLVEEMTALKAENKQLTEENNQLKDTIAPCRNELTQAQKELAEANDLLIEMRIEMNNWKTNILGFREEMRNAENAQLDALVKILEVLGGQAKTRDPLAPGLESAAASPEDPNQVQPALQAATASKQVNG